MRTTYMKQLDGLREFAILFTMITHFTLSQQGILGGSAINAVPVSQ